MKSDYLRFRKRFSVSIKSVFLLVILLFSNSIVNAQTWNEPQPVNGKKTFTVPEVPLAIVSPQAKIDYLVTHFWDNLDFSDTTYIHKPEILERSFIGYAKNLVSVDKNLANASIRKTLSRAEQEESGKMYKHFLSLFEKYFYEPYSPIRDDEFYITVTEYIIQDKRSDIMAKEWSKLLLPVLKQNRVGQPALDFTYTLASGEKGTLYDIESDYIVLFFYNPDCHACSETIKFFKDSGPITTAINNNRLKVLAIYPDIDLETWIKHLPDIPDNWINSYDAEQKIETQRLYDLKAIPTLYLLGKDKKVIFKDADFPSMEEWIARNI